MKTRLLCLLLITVSIAGCTEREKRRETNTASLTFSGVTNSADGSRLVLLTISNTLARPIHFWDIRPDRMACTVEIKNGDNWTNVNPWSYCATGWCAMTLLPGQTHTMQMQYLPISTPWRVGFSYWIETERSADQLRSVTFGGDRDVYKIWTPEIPPLEDMNKPNDASQVTARKLTEPER